MYIAMRFTEAPLKKRNRRSISAARHCGEVEREPRRVNYTLNDLARFQILGADYQTNPQPKKANSAELSDAYVQ